MVFNSVSNCLLVIIIIAKSDTSHGSGGGVGNFFFKLYPDVSWPSGLSACQQSMEVSLLRCAQLCTSTQTCVSAYMLLDNDVIGSRRWQCHSCESTVSQTTLQHGLGSYAVIKHMDVGNTPPPIPSGTFQKIDYINGVKAAFYNCDINFIKIRLAVDTDTGMWPRMRGACLDNFCVQATLSTCAARVTFDASGFIIQPVCQTGETTDGFSRCSFNGAWTHSSASGVHCISSTCYRKNIGHRTFYKGFKTTTYDGLTCQRWENMSPHYHTNRHHHLYVVDGYSYNQALNYCRDPDVSGAPWCYTTSSKRWDYCGIPLCQ